METLGCGVIFKWKGFERFKKRLDSWYDMTWYVWPDQLMLPFSLGS